MSATAASPLLQTVTTTPTDYWNDSCSIEELSYGIEHGAVGATTNPQEEMAVRGARLLEPTYERHQGKKGRLSIQTNPQNYRNAGAIAKQAIHFNTLAPNMQVKAPVTAAGVQAIEEATCAGVSINATVSFTVPQMLAVGEAIERGLKRREAEGLDVSRMAPVCTMMIGRLDDWMKVVAQREGIDIPSATMDWAGIAAFKKACSIYRERGYRTRPLAAAYRHLGHWSELIGGDVVLTIPYEWAKKINASDIPVVERMQNPVDPKIVAALYTKIPDFRRAYDEDGMTPQEFDGYGATVRTLRSFIAAVHELTGIVRDYMLPDPDLKQ